MFVDPRARDPEFGGGESAASTSPRIEEEPSPRINSTTRRATASTEAASSVALASGRSRWWSNGGRLCGAIGVNDRNPPQTATNFSAYSPAGIHAATMGTRSCRPRRRLRSPQHLPAARQRAPRLWLAARWPHSTQAKTDQMHGCASAV